MRGFYAFDLLLIIISRSDVNTLAGSRNSSPKTARIPVPSTIVGFECDVVAASLRLSFLRSSYRTYPRAQVPHPPQAPNTWLGA
jgi:hypothetical protein